MRITQRRVRHRATTTVLDDIAAEDDPRRFEGFEVDAVPLPALPTGISDEARRQAAVIVLRLQRGATPEQIATRAAIEAQRLFDEDELEREEALAHVAILAGVLSA